MSHLWIDDCPQGFNGNKVMLATPAYDNPDASYTFSIQRSRQALAQAGIGSMYLLLSGNCHVDDSRNSIVREFLETDCTDLVFLDSDVSWEPESLIELCTARIEPLDIAGGVYPYRRNGVMDVPVLGLEGAEPRQDGLIEVKGLPTGFMRIRRPVLDRLRATSPSFRNKAGDVVPLIFERTINDGIRYGGDIGFCLKVREQGGRCYALAEVRLGHVTKSIRWGSYASSMRLKLGETIRYVAHRVRHGGFNASLLQEAIEADGNIWGAPEEVLMIAIGLARRAEKPILELGSGLSTILMAAATNQEVHCLEHSMAFAHRTQAMADACELSNIEIYVHPLTDGFYKVPDTLPPEFSFLFVDGPPRHLGKRSLFAERVPNIPDTLLFDDADTHGFKVWAEGYAMETGRKVVPLPTERAMLMWREAPIHRMKFDGKAMTYQGQALTYGGGQC